MLILLQNKEWNEQWYELDQKVYIVLYISSLSDIQKIPEMKVEWYMETVTDAYQNTISTGFIIKLILLVIKFK
ncbi:20943_t:CDS:1, partial [Gigaspora margarita]